MSEVFSSLIVVCDDEKSAYCLKSGFHSLLQEDYKISDSFFKDLGLKTTFARSQPGVESLAVDGTMITLHGIMSKFNIFPAKFLCGLPGANAIVLEEYSDENFSTKSTIYIKGQKVSKKDLVNYLDALEPSAAFLLSLSVAQREIKKRFEALDSPSALIKDAPAYWHLVAAADQNEAARKLLSKQDLNKVDGDGGSLLHYTIRRYGENENYQLSDMVEFLIQQNHEVDVQDNNGITPLMLVSGSWRRSWAAKLLLDAGADPLLKDKEGKQAIHYACKSDDFKYLAQYLEEAGADLNALCKVGTPLWIINKLDRYSARQAFGRRQLVLAQGEDGYDGDSVTNLRKAIEHHDTSKYSELIDAIELSENEGLELLALSCDFKDAEAFTTLTKRLSLTPKASTLTNEKYLIDRLNFLYPEHPASGDSLIIGEVLLENDDHHGIRQLLESRDFIINLNRLIRWNSTTAVRMFTAMKGKNIDLSSIEIPRLLSGLSRDLGKEYTSTEDVKLLASNLVKLKEIGFKTAKAVPELKEAGVDERVLANLSKD